MPISSRMLPGGLVSWGALALALTTGVAHAGEAAEDPTTGTALGEIIVTAEKTASPLQKTPTAISVIAPDQMSKANVTSAKDLDKLVPGVSVNSGGAFPLNVTIRGVGYEGLQNDSSQPGVALLENGIYIASPANLSAAFFDIDQVEVLRGPQGTVNGQNADGGAININTGLASLKGFSVAGEASYGSYNYDRMRAMANVPLTDTLAVRVALQHEGHGGWLKAPNLAEGHADDWDAWSGRASVLWKPTDRLTVSVWAERVMTDQNAVGVKNNAADPLPGRQTSASYATPQSIRSSIVAGTIAYDLGGATLKSSISYQFNKFRAATSGDLLSFDEAVAYYGVQAQVPINDRLSRSWTEEVNLASRPGGPVDWIVGGFYLHTKSNISVLEVHQATPMAYPISFDPADAGTLFGAGLAFISVSNSVHESAAGYGQATWHVTDKLSVLGGMRYSWDKASALTSTYYSTPTPLSTSFKGVTGKAGVQYQATPGSQLYATFSTGVKPGGTNLNLGSTLVPNTFSHEMVRAYEVGSKNEFFGHKVRLNLSAFYNDYRNLQVDSEDYMPYLGGMTNIAKAHVYGLEGELSALLPAGFKVTANLSWMKSKVDSHSLVLDPFEMQAINRIYGIYSPADLAARAAALTDVKGNELGRVPRVTLNGSISKTTALGDLGDLDLYVDATYRSAYWYRIYNNPSADRIPRQFTMNFDARFQPREQPWYVELQITNLTGSNDIVGAYAENFGLGGVFQQFVAPRQFIGRVGFKF